MDILIAEDDVVSRRLLEATLVRYGFQVRGTGDGSEACRILLADDAPRLAILDWMLPGMDGIQVCREIRRAGNRPYTYIILLTAKDRKQDIIEGLESGADDYLVKPFDALELKARLKGARRILELQDQLIAARESLREQATHDALTGIWNRAAILEILDRELARGYRLGTPVGVIMADIDHFKEINDTYGHPAGDAALREAAQRMRISLRSYDLIGRYGGEEFLIVLPEGDIQSTAGLGERLRECIGGQVLVLPQGPSLGLTLSLGVASTGEGYQADPATLLRVADDALYRAKKAGRNRVECAPSPDASIH